MRPATELTEAEALRRTEEHRGRDRGLWASLLALREDKVHKVLGHASFETYAKVEFGYERAHVYRLLRAAEIERDLKRLQLETSGLNEAQARVLAKVANDHGEERMAEVAKAAIREGGFGPVTARRLVEIRGDVVAAGARHLMLTGLPEMLHEISADYRKLLDPLRDAEVPDDLEWIGGAEEVEKALRGIEEACSLGLGISKHLRQALGLPERSRAPEPERGKLGVAA